MTFTVSLIKSPLGNAFIGLSILSEVRVWCVSFVSKKTKKRPEACKHLERIYRELKSVFIQQLPQLWKNGQFIP